MRIKLTTKSKGSRHAVLYKKSSPKFDGGLAKNRSKLRVTFIDGPSTVSQVAAPPPSLPSIQPRDTGQPSSRAPENMTTIVRPVTPQMQKELDSLVYGWSTPTRASRCERFQKVKTNSTYSQLQGFSGHNPASIILTPMHTPQVLKQHSPERRPSTAVSPMRPITTVHPPLWDKRDFPDLKGYREITPAGFKRGFSRSPITVPKHAAGEGANALMVIRTPKSQKLEIQIPYHETSHSQVEVQRQPSRPPTAQAPVPDWPSATAPAEGFSFFDTPRTPMSFERTSSDLGLNLGAQLGYAGQSSLSRSRAFLFDSSAMAAPAGSPSSFAWLPKPPLRLLASSMQHLSPNLAAAGVRSASAPSWWA